MKRFFAKENTWFKAGTEAFLEADLSPLPHGIFRGKLEITERCGMV